MFVIALHSGTPSSGKSYDCIRDIIIYLRGGKWVIANFPVKFTAREISKGYADRFFYWPNHDITVDNLVLFALEKGMVQARRENQCIVVYDEAGGKYNPREWDNKDRYEWIQFFSQHAKLGFSFILVAQTDKMIDRQIRGFIEIENRYRKVNRFIGKGFVETIVLFPFILVMWLFHLTLFAKVQYWYCVKEKMGAEFFFFRKSVARRYDRYRMFDGFKFNATLMDKIKAYQDFVAGGVVSGEVSRIPDKVGPSLGDMPISTIFSEDKGGAE